ncbi:MAG: Nif3-like dinuclear metal center hexameric protein [Verrucomicrobiaceae bacterium]
MAKLQEIVEYLDKELRTLEIPDYGGAMNGLQLENNGTVTKVAAAVDASREVVNRALGEGADLLIVHHGMFWQGARPIRGAIYEKLSRAMAGNLAIYSSHIPLDVHPQWGNNAILAGELGMIEQEPFFDWKGIQLGIKGRFDGNLGALSRKLEGVLGGGVLLRGNVEEECGAIGLITGGAGSEVEAVAALGIDTFITGEGPHWSSPLAEEMGVNLLYGGHYATEVFGVQSVVKVLRDNWNLESCFIDAPTNL